MKVFVIILLIFYTFCNLSSQHTEVKQPPRLVVFININELQTEHLLLLSNKFGKYGFNQLINKGVFYHRATYNTLTSFKGTKLVNMHTGCYPSTHGLIGKSWYAKHDEKEEHAYGFIANNDAMPDSGRIIYPSLDATTISDELNLFYKGKSKIAAVSLDQEDIAYQGYSDKKLSFWFNRTTGEMTSAENSIILPWVKKYNSMQFSQMFVERQWGPLSDLKKYHEYIGDKPIQPRHFMYSMQNGSNNTLKYQKIIGSPYGNVLLRDFVAALIINEELGKDKYPDILSLTLSCKPFMDRNFELFDAEIEDMLIRLDDQIESLIQLVKDNVGIERTLFVFTSTPTIGWLPETMKKQKVNTGYFNGKKTSALLNLYLMAIYGQGKWVKGYHDKQFYFNHKLLEEYKIPLEEIQEKSAEFLLEVSGIDKTITSYHLRVNEYTTGEFNKFQQNYFYGRSGDLFISLKPGWTEEEIDLRKQTTISRESSFVPLIFYGWQTNANQIFESVEMINVAPTISKILQITEPNGCIGEPLNEVLE